MFRAVTWRGMGQRIQENVNLIGNIAVFSTDRSITGQEGRSYDQAPTGSNDPPTKLAARLFEGVADVVHVHAMSNTVSVQRGHDWDDHSLEAAKAIIEDLFVFYPPEMALSQDEMDDQLRDQNYNAAISHIREHNEDLWVIRVVPDEPLDSFLPGQYTTLALGYWEPRADAAIEEFEGDQREKLARRSYSVSSSVVDENGDLMPADPGDVEFYIVKVRPGEEETPALTPRIFMKGEGDRIFMGRKFTGHYTLEGVAPTDNVVFLATGTGEAPQNAMIAELLRREHRGKIISVVCVRYRKDLAYTDQQKILTNRYPNYHYLTLATREPDTIDHKVYIQDLVVSGRLEEELGAPLDPGTTHVYLCGNPSMIGLPSWDGDGTLLFPEVLGVCQILHERGFTISRRRERGNVHYEEYWKTRPDLE